MHDGAADDVDGLRACTGDSDPSYADAVRVLILTYGAAGDVHPFIALGLGLRDRGHDVTLLLDREYEATAAGLGLRFASLGEPVAPPAKGTRVASALTRPHSAIAFMRHFVIPRIPRVVAAVEREVRELPPDLIVVHHSAGFGAPWVARRAGIPWAMGAVAPASWTSLEQPNIYPGMPDRDAFAPWAVKLGVAVGKGIMCRALDPGINRVRRSLGLPRGAGFLFDEMFEGSANLGFWSPVVRPLATDDKPRSHICGFTFFDRRASERDEQSRVIVDRFLDEGPPPVLFTLGTSVPHALEAFFEAAATACRSVGVRGLMLGGRSDAMARAMPEVRDVLLVPYVPIGSIIGRCRAAVLHAGLGTMAVCMRAGVPMLCIPFMHDQFDNASRARRLGVARTADRRRLRPETLAHQLRLLLEDVGLTQRCREIRSSLSNEDGGARGAEILERIVASP